MAKEKTVGLIYLNDKQIQFLNAPQKRKALIAGRGFGKTHVMGHHEYRLFKNLPTGKSLIVSATYYQLLTKTCPELESAWREYGIKEWDPKTKTGHWVFGKKPPSHFEKPFKMPKNPEYCYFFLNGHVKELGSMEVKDRFRGGSYDSLSGDESALFKEEVWKKIFMTSVRGRTAGRGAWNPRLNYMAHSICHFTSAPWMPEGRWVFDWEEMAKQYPDRYFYVSGQTIDNVDVLGQDYIEDLRQTLSPLEWYVEVLNGKLDKPVGGGFYPAFSTERHVDLNTYEYEFGDGARKVKRDTFIHPQLPLLLSMDFNTKFTCMIVCQQVQQATHQEFRIADNLYVKPDPLSDKEGMMAIDRLVDKFCDEYRDHPIKYVELYGDASANNNRIGAPPMFEQARKRFIENGWTASIKAAGKLPEHQGRHILINNILRRPNNSYPLVRINGNKCKALIMSITNAPMLTGFKKDKRSENQNIPQEFATHLSDTADYIWCSLYSRLAGDNLGEAWSSFMNFNR